MKNSYIDELKSSFIQQGYIVLPQALSDADTATLEQVSQALNTRSQELLTTVKSNNQNLSDFYRENLSELIAVPEFDNEEKVCRYEYLNGYSQQIKTLIVPKLQQMIRQLTDTDFVLFKDKCNAKNPGGGAFEPHQDIIAYDQFKPAYHVTAAIFLDDATLENGCLYFPKNYQQDLADLETRRVPTPVGDLPILQSYEGGTTHGNIRQEICDQMNWTPITAKAGDVVLFDSYVPHYSKKNESQLTRRAMFFTFNPLNDGDFYEAYYDMKHREFDNPKFHVATPTAHSKREL
ncbi:phytanoyl-CoA dioxygenase family protein [Neptunomonas japonica]|uniref:phytanoyl-CoA dioxygenase family protein n=1 Tax=Neptunomonas japonica TaxID=417574 RepID=UPI0003F8AF83|nr:phytanoyl-CoA dioxygenase family protein [Neptunomonas japonica]